MSVGNIAMGGGDPRMSISEGEKNGVLGGEGITSYSRPQLLGIRDPSIKFEQYVGLYISRVESATKPHEYKHLPPHNHC